MQADPDQHDAMELPDLNCEGERLRLTGPAMCKQKSIPPQLLKAAIEAFGDDNTAKEWWWSTHEFTLQMCPANLALTPKGRKFIKNYLASLIDLNSGASADALGRFISCPARLSGRGLRPLGFLWEIFVRLFEFHSRETNAGGIAATACAADS